MRLLRYSKELMPYVTESTAISMPTLQNLGRSIRNSVQYHRVWRNIARQHLPVYVRLYIRCSLHIISVLSDDLGGGWVERVWHC